MKVTKNIAASIRGKLLNRAQADSRPFNEILQYYAMERFLYRLSLSPYAHQFILKGALMLRVWNAPAARPTMDIDMLGRTSNEIENIIGQVKNILEIDVIADGVIFDAITIQAQRIKEDADYQGVRVKFKGSLELAKIHLQIDVAFGDIIHPGPEELILPTILDLPPPKLLAYSRESVIAEKFEAIVALGFINSRMKDFYDIWLLLRQFNFHGAQLAEAIKLTFNQRATKFPAEVDAFTDLFIQTKQTQWMAFCKRLQQDYIPTDFKDIVLPISAFLLPLLDAVSKGKTMPNIWALSGQWS